MRHLLPALAVLLVSGCATTPAQDAGQYPSNYESLVRAALRGYPADPGSFSNLTIGKPFEVSDWGGLVRGGSYDKYWVVCATFNAKNSLGAYTGLQAHSVYIRDGQVVEIYYDDYYPGPCQK